MLRYEEVLKQAKQLYYEEWDWLAENPVKKDGSLNEKRDWPRWEENGGDVPYVFDRCFACFVDAARGGGCIGCPCDWGNGRNGCNLPGSPFYEWNLTKTPRTRKKYALLVRDAWKEEGAHDGPQRRSDK